MTDVVNKKPMNKKGNKAVRIFIEDVNTHEPLTAGVSYILNEDDTFSLSDAVNLITGFTASEQKEDNALVVTAHLMGGETWSETYSEHTKKAFYPDLALDSFKMKLTHKVWEFMTSLKNLAMCTECTEKEKETT